MSTACPDTLEEDLRLQAAGFVVAGDDELQTGGHASGFLRDAEGRQPERTIVPGDRAFCPANTSQHAVDQRVMLTEIAPRDPLRGPQRRHNRCAAMAGNSAAKK